MSDFRYIILFSSIENLVLNVKFMSFFIKTVFLNYTTRFSIQSTIFFYRKPRFRCKVSVFPCKNCVFLTIQPDFRYKILFSSIENLVFDVKFQSFIVKTVLFNYTTAFSIHNTIFFYRRPRFRCKISVFPCKNGVF